MHPRGDALAESIGHVAMLPTTRKQKPLARASGFYGLAKLFFTLPMNEGRRQAGRLQIAVCFLIQLVRDIN